MISGRYLTQNSNGLIVITFVVYILPVLLELILACIIALRLLHNAGKQLSTNQTQKYSRRTTKTTLLLATAFLTFQMPFGIFWILGMSVITIRVS